MEQGKDDEVVEVPDDAGYPQQKKTITQSANDLKKLKITDLVQLLADLTGHQPTLPRKPRKPELISKINEIAILRSE